MFNALTTTNQCRDKRSKYFNYPDRDNNEFKRDIFLFGMLSEVTRGRLWRGDRLFWNESLGEFCTKYWTFVLSLGSSEVSFIFHGCGLVWQLSVSKVRFFLDLAFFVGCLKGLGWWALVWFCVKWVKLVTCSIF